ncbi:MAG: site-specific DNA-methyltransferase [Paracoccus sp.]|nr:site-specific DNA-methyltransferase [Paracoccus sp. (in: a-proteobacteria)]
MKTTRTKAQSRKISLAKLIVALEEYRQYAPAHQGGMIDNIDALAGLQQMDDNSATAMVTDPPYGIDLADWDSEVPGVEIWKEALRVLKPGAFAVVAAAPRTAHKTAAALEAAGFVVRDMLVWRYGQSFPGAWGVDGEWRSNLKTNQEPWVVAQKPLTKGLSLWENWKIWGTGCVRTGASGGSTPWKTNVIDCPKPSKKERNLGTGYLPFPYTLPKTTKSGKWKNCTTQKNTHPTVKPLALMRAIVRAFCPDNGLVIDPFLGSGTTAMAALAEGHSFAGFELNPGYWSLATERACFALDHPHLVPPPA